MSEPSTPAAANRQHVSTLAGGLKLYRVRLAGGPFDGTTSLCSHDTVIDHELDLATATKAALLDHIANLRAVIESSIVREPKPTVNELHPTVKPLGIVARHLFNSSRAGETVGELFGGSGTTLIAAEQTGRRCVVTEDDEKYCAVILERAKGHGLEIAKLNG